MGNILRSSLVFLLVLLGPELGYSAFIPITTKSIKKVTTGKTLPVLKLVAGGYDDQRFEHTITITPHQSAAVLNVASDFQRSLQYTLSTLEGRIVSKGRIFREAELNLSRLREGQYVMYFFRGRKVVKAVLVDRV